MNGTARGMPGSAGAVPAVGRRPAVLQAGGAPTLPGWRRAGFGSAASAGAPRGVEAPASRSESMPVSPSSARLGFRLYWSHGGTENSPLAYFGGYTTLADPSTYHWITTIEGAPSS